VLADLLAGLCTLLELLVQTEKPEPDSDRVVLLLCFDSRSVRSRARASRYVLYGPYSWFRKIVGISVVPRGASSAFSGRAASVVAGTLTGNWEGALEDRAELERIQAETVGARVLPYTLKAYSAAAFVRELRGKSARTAALVTSH
jgi:hypothetical protein